VRNGGAATVDTMQAMPDGLYGGGGRGLGREGPEAGWREKPSRLAWEGDAGTRGLFSDPSCVPMEH
jgi:hypothetical protein